MKDTNDDVLDTPEDEDVWNGDPLFEEKQPTKAKPKRPTGKALECTQKGCHNLQTADGEFCDKHYPKAKTQLYYHRTTGGAEYLTDVFVSCPDGHREGIFEGARFVVRIDGDITKDATLTVKEPKAIKVASNMSKTPKKSTGKAEQRFSLFICDYHEDHDWREISAFTRKHGLPFMDSFNSEISDDKVLVLSDRPFTTELANDIWETTLQEETHDLIGLEVFTYAEYLEAKKETSKCDICYQSEDQDGRCGCTNKDAHSTNCTRPDCSSIS